MGVVNAGATLQISIANALARGHALRSSGACHPSGVLLDRLLPVVGFFVGRGQRRVVEQLGSFQSHYAVVTDE
jgi:hypothetical protein